MGISLVVTAVVAGVASGTAAATAAAAAFTIGFSFAAAATSLALGALSVALAPKPKRSAGTGGGVGGAANLSGSLATRAEGFTQNVRQAVTARRFLYGEARIGGSLNFIETTGNNKYLHMVVSMVDHEVDSIGEIWLDNQSIPPDALNASGMVTNGRYTNKVRIKKFLGTPNQTADPDLVAETSATSNFRGRSVAGVYVRLEYDSDIFPSQIPVVTAWVRGRKITDPRDDVKRWTPNAALMTYDYLTTPLNGLVTGAGVDTADVNEAEIIASANTCEEIVDTADIVDSVTNVETATNTFVLRGLNNRLQYQLGDRVRFSGLPVPGGLSAGVDYYVIPYQRRGRLRIQVASSLENAIAGTPVSLSSASTGTVTKTGEPRYFGGGVVETGSDIKTNIDDMLTAMVGSIVYIGGQWSILAGAYNTPVYSFDENHIISKITVRPKNSRKDRFNLVKGVYVAPINDGHPGDYPSVTNSTYQTQDGEVLPIDFDLPMTQRPHTAQRLAKIKLEKHRQEIFFEADFSLHACQVQPGDVVNITNSKMGWSNKPFEVIKWTLDQRETDGTPFFYVKMTLQETASNVYNWSLGEETVVDPAPDTNLPDPFTVGLPGAPEMSEELVLTRAGAGVKSEVTLTSVASIDPFVNRYQFRYKQIGAAEYVTLSETTEPRVVISDVQPGVYDFEARAINNLGVKSAWVVNSPLEVLGLLSPPAAPQNLNIQSISSFAILRWAQSSDIDVTEGGKVVFRHSPALTGASWPTSTSIGDAVPGRAVDTILPLKSGTYLVRFFDSSGVAGEVTTVTTKAAKVLEFANVDFITENPLFSGNKTNVVLDSSQTPDVIKLGGSGLFDDIADFDAEPNIDLFGGITNSGTYDFAAGIDLTTVQKVRLEATLKARVVNELDNFDSRSGNIDSWEDFDGDNAGSADATIWVRETDDDPSGSPVWSAWNRLDVGEYEARAFDFQLRMTSSDPAYNIYVEELSVSADQ